MDLLRQIDVRLRPLGFVRRGNRWNRRGEQYVDVIQLSTIKGGGAVRIDVGVLYVKAYEVLFNRQLPRSIDEAECTVRARLGVLIETTRDRLWSATNPELAIELGDDIVKYAVPFCDAMHDAQRMIVYLTPPSKGAPGDVFAQIQAYILEWEVGDRDEACRRLVRLRNKAQHDRVREIVGEVLGRLGCQDGAQVSIQSPG